MSEFVAGASFALAVWYALNTVASLFMLGKTFEYTTRTTMMYLVLTLVFLVVGNLIYLGVL